MIKLSTFGWGKGEHSKAYTPIKCKTWMQKIIISGYCGPENFTESAWPRFAYCCIPSEWNNFFHHCNLNLNGIQLSSPALYQWPLPRQVQKSWETSGILRNICIPYRICSSKIYFGYSSRNHLIFGIIVYYFELKAISNKSNNLFISFTWSAILYAGVIDLLSSSTFAIT